MTGKNRRGRAAFTMLELMIVIAIIAMLAALLLGAVTRVLAMQARTECLHEMKKFEQSLQVAMGKYNNIPNVPSRLILINDINVYRLPDDPPAKLFTTKLTAGPYNFTPAEVAIAKQTANVLRYMFGRRLIGQANTPGSLIVSWGPGGQQGFVKLKGAECLVFYLGGVPDPPVTGKLSGFSDNATNPLASGGERIGPFYEFKATRLKPLGNTGYFGYVDPFRRGVPYAFFGTTAKNGYSTFGGDDCYDTLNNVGLDGQFGPNGMSLGAYFEPGATTNYLNPNLFQIISAGRDGRFGPGGGWDPATGIGGDAADNLANFTQTELGNPRD